jgi:serine/threonine protein kinase
MNFGRPFKKANAQIFSEVENLSEFEGCSRGENALVLPESTDEGRAFAITVPFCNSKFRFLDTATGRVRPTYWLWLGTVIAYILYFCWLNLQSFLREPSLLSEGSGILLLVPAVLMIGGLLCLILGRFCQTLFIGKGGIDSCVRLTKTGWHLPGVFKALTRRQWRDLECVRFVKAGGLPAQAVAIYGPGDSIVLDWKARRLTKMSPLANTSFLNLSALSSSEKDELFTALSRFVPQELLTPEVLYLQVQALSGKANSDLSGYTQIWLDEYNANFELSNNVTLAPGAKCGNGRFVISMTIAVRFNSSTYLASSFAGEKVVIKELVAPLDGDDENDNVVQKKLLEQFNREAAILAELAHPSIVEVVDHFIENHRSYIVMTHAQGQNIREYVRLNGALPEAEVLKIALQMAGVLQYLHHHNPIILHRDFTPDNLVYAPDGSIKVVDFGAANLYNTGKTATLIGKQNYMPPEQLRGKPSPASDIYAFGASLSYLLTGKDLPSMGKLPTFDESRVSSELIALIQRCTAFEPEERPDCDEVISQLEAITHV